MSTIAVTNVKHPSAVDPAIVLDADGGLTTDGALVWSGSELRADSSSIATQQTTTSTSFTDLATVGPSVTLNTGTKALVTVTSGMQNSSSNDGVLVSFAISGATTVSAGDDFSLIVAGVSMVPNNVRTSFSVLVTGLTAGSNTFTMKFKSISGGTASFYRRNITVVDMGS